VFIEFIMLISIYKLIVIMCLFCFLANNQSFEYLFIIYTDVQFAGWFTVALRQSECGNKITKLT